MKNRLIIFMSFFKSISYNVTMKKISLCMIVRNESSCLENCLSSVKNCVDEIIIVDTGSTDNTVEIAKKFTDKVYFFEWQNDFSLARNFSFDKATNDYILWLDADDIVPAASVNKINEWKKSGEDCDTMMCKYVTGFDENHKPTFQFYRERIVKNLPILRWHDAVHEVIAPYGKIVYRDDISVHHNKKSTTYSSRNLKIYQSLLEKGEDFSPRQQFYYARELYFNNMIDEAIHEFSKFLSSGKGWVENNIECCLNLARCYLLKGELENALTALFGSFVYDCPRGEILYEIGYIFELKKDYKKAIYWYEQAMAAKPNTEGGGFCNLDAYTFLPALQLCVCYYKIGNYHTSRHYHEIAKGFRPENPQVKNNEKFFTENKNDNK